MPPSLTLLGLLTWTAAGPAQEAKPASKPQWQRMLTGDDEKKATELERRIAVAQVAGNRAAALKPAEELLALRARIQGEDHWQTRDARIQVGDLRWPLTADQRKQLAEIPKLNQDALKLYLQGKHDPAAAIMETILRRRREVLGDGHPAVANTLSNLAALFEARHKYPEAERLFHESLGIRAATLGEKHPDAARSLHELSHLRQSQARFADAEALCKRALAVRREALGDGHEETAESLNNLAALYHGRARYADAETLYQEALAIRRKVLGSEDRSTLTAMNNLAALYSDLARYADAEALLQEVVRVRTKRDKDAPETAVALSNLAVLYESQGRPADAEPAHREALRVRRAAFGPKHPETAITLLNLGHLLGGLGKYAEAEALAREGLAIRKTAKGDDDPDTALARNNLAALLKDQARFADAEPLYRDALQVFREKLGESHPTTAVTLNNLALLCQAQGRFAEAEALLQDALRARRAAVGERHPATAQGLNNLARLYQAEGQYARAEPLLRAALAVNHEVLGERHPETVTSLNNLAGLYLDQRRYADAEPLFREAVRLREDALGNRRHPDLADAYHNLANLCGRLGRYVEAEARYRDALALFQEFRGKDHPSTATCGANLARLYLDRHQYEKAEPLFRRALEVYRTAFGAHHPDVARSVNDLAILALARGRAAEAEALFRDAVRIHRDTQGDGHPDTTSSLNNLAFAVAAQGRPADTAAVLTECVRSHEASRLALGPAAERGVGASGHDPYPLLAAVAARMGQPAAAVRALEAHLARGLLDEVSGRGPGRLNPDEQRSRTDLVGRLRAVQARVLHLSTRRELTDGERTELATLAADRRRVLDSLADLGAAESTRALADLARIQTALDPAAALVAWVDVATVADGVDEHWACVVRRTGPAVWERLAGAGPGGRWTDADRDGAGRLRAALRGRVATPADIDRLAALVRERRLAPIERHLGGARRLLVVGADDMAGLPVELLAPGYQVEYVPSGTAVARAAGRGRSGGEPSLLAVGDPVLPPAGPTPERPLPPGGVLVQAVVEGGAAFRILRPGDVLLAYGGAEVPDVETLGKAIAARAGDKLVSAKVWRMTETGEAITQTVELAPGRLGVTLSREPARDVLAARHKADQQVAALTRSGRPDPTAGRKTPWPELPGTAVELAALKHLLGDRATVLARSEASEQRLDELRRDDKLRTFRYLHFATHGVADYDRAFGSFLVLAQDRLPRPADRGELSARAVLDQWKLDCELVTLSACESGLGRAAGGDGLLGFAQAFLVAGARGVCVSLWRVDDTATSLLMARFYQNLLGKRAGLAGPLPKGAALREAKAWLRNLTADEVLRRSAAMRNGVTRGKDEDLPPAVTATDLAPTGDLTIKPYQDPRYWAAFILIGDPD